MAAQLKKLPPVVSVGFAVVILHNKDLPGSLGYKNKQLSFASESLQKL